MRHCKGNNKIGLPTDQRMALIKNGACALILNKQIKTTDARARQISRYVESIITKAKSDTVHARREVSRMIANKSARTEVFSKIMVDRYAGMNGGYTRIIKFGIRRGDAANISVLELV